MVVLCSAMKSKNSTQFGTEPLGKLLRKQAIPSSIGILVLSIYGIVDTIFVGHFVGGLGIGAITVVLPITYLIGSIGMAIGNGGASMISRAFGREENNFAYRVFDHQVVSTLLLAIFISVLSYLFIDDILQAFGGRGDLLGPAKEYFSIVLMGIPFLAWGMMSNNVIRAEGYPKTAMVALLIPALTNTILDPIFIVGFDMGLKGAAWATALSYMLSSIFTLWFFIFGPSEMSLSRSSFRFDLPLLKEMSALGSVTLARQGTVSVLSIVLNNSLFVFGGEFGVSVFGIVNRVLMFANFPVLGIAQGFVPILGYNYGAKLSERVQHITRLALGSATTVSFILFVLILSFAPFISTIFTNDTQLADASSSAIRMVFLATPLLAMSLLGSAYFQAIGQPKMALILALSKQGFLLIPLILILPQLIGIEGIWYSFPLADAGAAIIAFVLLKRKGVNLMPIPRRAKG